MAGVASQDRPAAYPARSDVDLDPHGVADDTVWVNPAVWQVYDDSAFLVTFAYGRRERSLAGF